jgi:hypothetical protein
MIALTDTASQIAELQRRQKLAEALAAQGAAPIEVQSYKGIQAPISPFSVLAKVLDTYTSKKQMADIAKGDKEARQTARDEAVSFFQNLDKTATPNLVAPTGAPEMINTGAPTADFTPASGSLKDMRKQLKTTPDEIAAAKNFVPPAQPVQAAQPPIMQAPGVDGSITGAPMVRAVPGPVDNGPARMPMANAPTIQAPQLYGNEQAPVAAYTPQQKMAMLLEGSMSGNPYVKKMAPSMYDALQTKIASDEDLARKIKGIDSLNLPPKQKQALVSAAAIGGAKGLETATSEVIKGQVGEHFVPAEPEDLAGYPKGTTGQISTITGKLTNVYNPSGDLNAAAQLKLSERRLGIDGDQLDISRQRLKMEKDAKDNAILDPQTIDYMAQQAAAGDTSVFRNLGRGQAGAVNAVALRKALYTYGTPGEIAAKNAQFPAIGRRAGASTFALAEVAPLAELSTNAYSVLPRDQFKPFNKLRNLVESGTNSPEQAAALTADVGLIAAYARALNPNGIGRKSDMEKGEKLLNSAQSPQAHAAVVNQMLKEVEAIRRGAKIAQGLKPDSMKDFAKGGGKFTKAPAGIDQADWDVLTPEEKKTWK